MRTCSPMFFFSVVLFLLTGVPTPADDPTIIMHSASHTRSCGFVSCSSRNGYRLSLEAIDWIELPGESKPFDLTFSNRGRDSSLGAILFSALAAIFLHYTLSFLRSKIKAPPFIRLQGLADFLFSRRTYEAIMEPTLRDLLDEYCEALAANRPWKARWVRVRGYWSFWSAVFAQLPISAVKMVYKIWKATR